MHIIVADSISKQNFFSILDDLESALLDIKWDKMEILFGNMITY